MVKAEVGASTAASNRSPFAEGSTTPAEPFEQQVHSERHDTT
jgi:hypothetical protein